MSGPLTWWANRKSRTGLSPAALKPPHVHGKEWWTTPPVALPQPEHIEYVVQFMREVQHRPQTPMRDTLLGHISDWLRAARRLLHEESYSPDRADLATTDGLLIACEDTFHKLISECHRAGVRVDGEIMKVQHALERRTGKLRRERAIESSKRVSRPYWEDRKP